MSKGKSMSSYEIEPIFEQELIAVDETKLPMILAERLELLEKTNRAYDAAKEQERITREKVDKALGNADKLIETAEAARSETETEKSHRFLWFEWTSKSDEINELKNKLEEMISCDIKSAEAQKELVEVQSSLVNSQTALLQVQKTQMAYQHQIADATKFLYGLSAYNMASTQSVLINLQAVLSGASKEKLGEMAQQQLLLAMDQLKNQENIILRIRENRELVDGLYMECTTQDGRIESNTKKNSEQDRRIDVLEKSEKKFLEKEIKQDALLQASAEHDKKQDMEIASQAKKDEEQDKRINVLEKSDKELFDKEIKQDALLQASAEHDKKQDMEIASQAKKDEEQDRRINVLEKSGKEFLDKEIKQDALLQASAEHDKKQDIEIAAQAKKGEEHDRLLHEGVERDRQQDELLRSQAVKGIEHKNQLDDLKNQNEEFEKTISSNVERIAVLEEEIGKLKIEKTGRRTTIIAYVVAVTSLGLAIIQFFL